MRNNRIFMVILTTMPVILLIGAAGYAAYHTLHKITVIAGQMLSGIGAVNSYYEPRNC